MQRHLKAICPRYKHRDKKMPELSFVSEKGAEGNLKVCKFEQDRSQPPLVGVQKKMSNSFDLMH